MNGGSEQPKPRTPRATFLTSSTDTWPCSTRTGYRPVRLPWPQFLSQLCLNRCVGISWPSDVFKLQKTCCGRIKWGARFEVGPRNHLSPWPRTALMMLGLRPQTHHKLLKALNTGVSPKCSEPPRMPVYAGKPSIRRSDHANGCEFTSDGLHAQSAQGSEEHEPAF